MNNFEQQPGAPEIAPPNPEQDPEPNQPRIYVASLSDYNAGRLHGRWIDAGQIVDDVQREIAEMLDESRELVAEEYAIHDYEGFGPLQLGEYESIETLARIAEGIVEHGMAFAHWISCIGIEDEDGRERFDDVYLGCWDSMEQYAEQFVDDLGLERMVDEAVPDSLRGYVRIDIEGLARDLEIECATSRGEEGVYVFDPR